jgi:hypothetical protein
MPTSAEQPTTPAAPVESENGQSPAAPPSSKTKPAVAEKPVIKPATGGVAKPTLVSDAVKPTLASGGAAKPTLASGGAAKPTLGSGDAKPTLDSGAVKPKLSAPTKSAMAASPARPAGASTTSQKIVTEGDRRWVRPLVAAVVAVMVLAVVVLVAQWLRTIPSVQAWLVEYPGHSDLPATAPVGLPAWLGWQHFFNAFFVLLIIRSGWKVRTTTRPEAYWIRHNTGLLKTKNPPKKMSLDLWLHLSLDVLWVLNGIVFIVLLFVSGQWMRIVPTSWDIIPNAAASALQYASLDWPLENGWVHYNALQVLAYFTVVFLAAPLAVITGLRMSPAWPKDAPKLNKAYPVEIARAIHLPVMFFFTGFIVVHVLLVFTTGALRNLNHMYASQDTQSWTGFWIFVASLAVMVAAWFLARPAFLSPVASFTGKVSR